MAYSSSIRRPPSSTPRHNGLEQGNGTFLKVMFATRDFYEIQEYVEEEGMGEE
jgi:hypothetical protein